MTLQKVKDELEYLLSGCARDPYMRGTSKAILDWFRPFANTVLANAHEFATDKPVVLLTVCSYAKPYSNSFIHYGIDKDLYDAGLWEDVEKWHLSSAGVIPSALEEEVPFCSYDWNNADASEEDLEELRLTLQDYFARWLALYLHPLGKRLVTYFRRGSNTQNAIDNTPMQPSQFPCRVIVDPSLPEEDEPKITLGGRHTDPDCALLHPYALDSLVSSLRAQIKVAEESE